MTPSRPHIRLIGVDCATVPDRTGVAVGQLTAGGLQLLAVHSPTRTLDVAGVVGEALGDHPDAILALDAPLGWPLALGAMLPHHHAGAVVEATPAALFSRATDHALHRRLGKQPLEVGADRIARTAVAALALLATVRAATGRSLPVATVTPYTGGAQAIEVYPAALVAADGHRVRGREAVAGAKLALAATALGDSLAPHLGVATAAGDALDAILCVVAAGHHAAGRTVPPPIGLAEAARREGWIWSP